MIKLVLLTGFLGSGKTTLLDVILKHYKTRKIGLIVNEFGEINIDARLLERNGITMSELSNGSIFCACIKENFVNGLIEMSKENIEYLFIEASGLADPSSMAIILDTIKDSVEQPYSYLGSICVIDAEAFLELKELLPAVSNQLTYAGAVIVNKTDLVGPDVLENIKKQIKELNAKAEVYFTTYCNADIDALTAALHPSDIQAAAGSNTPESRPMSITLKVAPDITVSELQEFLQMVAPCSYRIKGFVKAGDKNYSISAVRAHVMMLPWPEEIPFSEIVIISSIGVKLTSIIINAIDKTVPGKITL